MSICPEQFWPGFIFGAGSTALIAVVALLVMVHFYTSNRQGDY